MAYNSGSRYTQSKGEVNYVPRLEFSEHLKIGGQTAA